MSPREAWRRLLFVDQALFTARKIRAAGVPCDLLLAAAERASVEARRDFENACREVA